VFCTLYTLHSPVEKPFLHQIKKIQTNCGRLMRLDLYIKLIMPPLLLGGGIKRWFCLTYVCLTSIAYIGPKSRTDRPRNTKIGTRVVHVTRDSDTTYQVKGQGYQAALLTTALAHQTAAAVSVQTYWAWETTATLQCARQR